MSKRSITIGPGASSLILVVVVVSMSVLCMLSLYSASNELKLANRAAEVVQTIYTLNEMAEDSAQNAVMGGETGTYEWEESYSNAILYCAIEIENGSYTWKSHMLEIPGETEEWN